MVTEAKMEEKKLIQVDDLDLLRQMVQNFNKPLELLREAISNSYDAGADNINIQIKRQPWEGEQRWIIKVTDDGAGMVREEKAPSKYTGYLEDFFKLGGSSRKKELGYKPVGEKCLGIKLALRSQFLRVKTWAGPEFPVWIAECNRPWASLFSHQFPDIIYSQEANPKHGHSFTELEIVGFYDNDGTHFQADEIQDYIIWFTKWGSYENRIKEHLKDKPDDLKLHTSYLRTAPKGIITLDAPGVVKPREIKFGHPFPDCSTTTHIAPNIKMENILSEADKLTYDKMLEKLDEAKKNHWRYIIEVGTLKELPDVYWEAIISVEGEEAKRAYNPFLRQRQGSKGFTYKAESRYGLWFCKDYFCIEQRNPVAMEILEKEGQRTRFQILLNCQNFSLNNDRNKVGGDANVIRGIEEVAKNLVDKMSKDDSWTWSKIIEEETEVRTSIKQDKNDLEERTIAAKKKPKLIINGKTLAPQPETEGETVLLLERLKNLYPNEFGFFDPLDWRTDSGIDCVVKSDEPGENCRFAEFKRSLESGHFNHTFEFLHYIVCWQVKSPEGSVLIDPAKKKRTLKRFSPEDYNLPQTAPWTLDGDQKMIRVYSLKDILLEKFDLQIIAP
jgi:hypothetical protein